MTDLSSIALALPNVEQGIACAGTALESRTYRTGNKAFLFVSKKDARLKLDSSASEARKLGFKVGANGWTTIPLEAWPSTPIAKRWISESHGLMAGAASSKKAKTKASTKSKR
jgi:hypothetical protein